MKYSKELCRTYHKVNIAVYKFGERGHSVEENSQNVKIEKTAMTTGK